MQAAYLEPCSGNKYFGNIFFFFNRQPVSPRPIIGRRGGIKLDSRSKPGDY